MLSHDPEPPRHHVHPSTLKLLPKPEIPSALCVLKPKSPTSRNQYLDHSSEMSWREAIMGFRKPKDPSKRFILFIVRTVETTLKLQDFRTPILILRQYRNPPAFSKGCYSNPKEWWFSAPKRIHSAPLGKSRHVLQCYLTKLNSRHVAGIPLTTQMGAMNFTHKIP